jgi:hypothetical protein
MLQISAFKAISRPVLHIWPIRTVCFCVLGECDQFIPNIRRQRKALFQYLADAHSANLYFSADSFRVFDEGGRIIISQFFLTACFTKGTLLKNRLYLCNWTQDLQGIIPYLTLGGQKIISTYSETTRIELRLSR